MSEGTVAAAALQLEIDTGPADQRLDALELRLGALGDNVGDAGAKRLAILAESLAALKQQADGTAQAFRQAQESFNSTATGVSATPQFAKLREENQALQTQLIAARNEVNNLKDDLGAAASAGTRMGESMRGMAIRVSSSIGSASTSLKGLVQPLDETNVGLTKLQTKLKESTEAFSKGIDPSALAKDVDTQVALASESLRKLEGIVVQVRKAAAFTEVGPETAITKYGRDIAGLVPHLQELEVALAKDKAALKLSEEAAAKAAASRKALATTLREGALAAKEDAQALAAYRASESSKLATEGKIDASGDKAKLAQVEAAWKQIEAADRAALATRDKLEKQHTALVAQQAKERVALEAKAAAEIQAFEEAQAAATRKALSERTALALKAAAEASRATDLLTQLNARRQASGGVTQGSGTSVLIANLDDGLNSVRAARSVDELSTAYDKLKVSVAAATAAEDYLARVQLTSAANAGAAAVKAADDRAKALNALNAIELTAIKREEALAVAYAKRSEAGRLQSALEARRTLDEGLDPTGKFSSQAIETAKAAESADALSQALSRVRAEERAAARSVDEYSSSITRAIALEKSWILSTEKVRLAQAIEAKKLLNANWSGDVNTSYAPQAVSLAQGSTLKALESQYKTLGGATEGSTRATKRWSDAQWEAHSAARGLAGSLGTLWATYGSLLPLLAGAAVGAGVKEVFNVGKALEYQLRFVSELSDGATISLKDFEAAASGALQTPLQAAEGMRALAQAGLSVKESLAVLPAVLNLATVGELDTGSAALAATGAIQAFGLSMTEIGRVSDVFAKAAAISNTSVKGMTEAMKQASTIADFYGISLEDSSASLALLAQRNIEGSASGTAFRNMMSDLAAPTEKAKKAMEKLGLELYDSEGNLKSYRDVVKQLYEAFANLDQKSRLTGLGAIFNERGQKAANTILSDYRQLESFFQQMGDSAGFVNTVIVGLKDTVQGDLQRALARLQTTFAGVFNDNAIAVHNLTSALAEFAASEDFKKFLDVVVKGFISLGQTLRDNISLFAEVGKVWLVALGTMKIIVPAINAVGVAVGALTASATSAGLAFKFFNAATGWIGLLGTLAASFLLLGKNTDQATEAQTRFSNHSDLLIGELERQSEALRTQIGLMRERRRAILEGRDTNEVQNKQSYELRNFAAEIDKQSIEVDKAQKKLDRMLQQSAGGAGIFSFSSDIDDARKALSSAIEARKKATEDYLKFYKTSSATIADYQESTREAELTRNLEAVRDINVRVSEAVKKGRDIKPIDVNLFDKLDIDKQKALLEEYKKLVGFEKVDFESSNNSSKSARDARRAALTDLKTDLSSFEGEYRASVERAKGLADEMRISTEDMFDLQQQALVNAWAAANDKLAEMRALAQGDPKELANVDKLRQKLTNDYVVNTQKLNNDRLKASKDYYDQVEALEIASGRKTLSNSEAFAREWYSRYGAVLEQALLRTKSASATIADAATTEVQNILSSFNLASQVNDISTALTKVGSEVEVFKNGLDVLLNKDSEGGLIEALLGNAKSIEDWKAKYIPALQAQLRAIEEQIANYAGDPEGLSKLIADGSKIRKQIEDGLRASSPSVKAFADDFGNFMAEALVYGFDKGESPAKSFAKMLRDELKKELARALSSQYNLIINAILRGGQAEGGGSSGWLTSAIGAGSNSALGSVLSSLGTVGSALSALTVGFGSAATAVGAVGLGGTLSAAGSLIGTGSAAGAAAGIGLGAGALAPYVTVAALVLDSLGAFKGSTPHKGGAYVASTDGTGFKATDATTPGFGLSWGAYRSDRSAGVDEATKTLSEGVAKGLAESLKTLGVDATFSVATRFASDNSDWSQGAIRVLDEAGNKIFDFSKKYTKNASQALEQFGVDTQRAIVATLSSIDLGGPLNTLFDSIDPVKAKLEDIAAVLQQAYAWVEQGRQIDSAISIAFDTPAERLKAAFDKLSLSIPDTVAAYEDLVRAQDLDTTAGRERALALLDAKSLWDEVQQAATDAADEAKSAWQDLKDSLTQFREELTTGALSGLSPEAAYQAASAKFTETSRLAKLGNQDALGSLADVSKALLEASKAYYASGEAYFIDKQKVLATVDSSISLTDRKLQGFAVGGVASGWSIVGEDGPELVNFTRPGRVYTASQTREVFGVDKSSNSRDEEIIVELKAIVGTLVNGIGSMDARLANLEKSSSEQAREARMANDRRRA